MIHSPEILRGKITQITQRSGAATTSKKNQPRMDANKREAETIIRVNSRPFAVVTLIDGR
jgi:hypothetical protein